MKNGYDRFAVDDAVERYLTRLDELEALNELYEKQLAEKSQEIQELREKYQSVLTGLAAREKASDDLTRIALKEANTIIETAQHNADYIIDEALAQARLVMNDAVKVSSQTDAIKNEMKNRLTHLIRDLDDFKTGDVPNLDWLDPENKMR
ncbi:MAG: DivIVA domain-containing protein [Erysipelotrichaceae bacterium]|nr:DivIVA domain-containing protein [Erysipelotrichaceae bacterium]